MPINVSTCTASKKDTSGGLFRASGTVLSILILAANGGLYSVCIQTTSYLNLYCLFFAHSDVLLA